MIDDDHLLLKINRRRLEPLGFDITTFTDGKSAYEAFRENPDKYDLIITDQSMPGYLGMDLTLKVHNIRPGLPVIICTGHSDIKQEDIDQFKGQVTFIFKPVQNDELIAAVINLFTT